MLLLVVALGLPVAVIGCVLALSNRRLLVYALPLLAALERLPIPVGGQRVRLDQLAAVFLILGLIPALLAGRRRLRFDAATGWILVSAGLNVLSTLLYSPAKGFSLLQLTALGSSWAIYVVLLNCLTTAEDLDGFVVAMLVAGIIEATIGAGAFTLGTIGVSVPGADVAGRAVSLTGAWGAYGTLFEPNIFGSYCAGCFVFALGLRWIAPRALSPARLGLVWIAIVTSAIGMFLSFTRGAWLAAAVGIMALAIQAGITLRQRGPMRAALITAVTTALILGAILVTPGQIGEFVRYKLVNILNPTSETAVGREVGLAVAWLQYVKHPILGWGTYTFLPLTIGTAKGFNKIGGIWMGNWVMLALHDTGAVGLVAFLGILVSAYRAGLRGGRVFWTSDRAASAAALSLTAVIIVFCIAFLFTSAFQFGFPWVFIGAIGAYGRLARESVASQRPGVDRRALAA
jgi:hypothetical protein